jgi:hypothetical protein
MSLLEKLIGAFAGTEQELPANAILIDVRSSGEYQAGYIYGAVSLPLGEVVDRIHSVVPDKDTPVIVYCQSGARSACKKYSGEHGLYQCRQWRRCWQSGAPFTKANLPFVIRHDNTNNPPIQQS